MSVIFFSFKTYSFFVKKTNQPTKQTNKQTIFSPNTGKYGPEIIPYLDTFQAVYL